MSWVETTLTSLSNDGDEVYCGHVVLSGVDLPWRRIILSPPLLFNDSQGIAYPYRQQKNYLLLPVANNRLSSPRSQRSPAVRSHQCEKDESDNCGLKRTTGFHTAHFPRGTSCDALGHLPLPL